MIRLRAMLAGLSSDPSLAAVAGEVEASTRAIITAAAGTGPEQGSPVGP